MQIDHELLFYSAGENFYVTGTKRIFIGAFLRIIILEDGLKAGENSNAIWNLQVALND